MGAIKVFPSVFVQRFVTGASLSGIAPVPGTDDSGETLYRGRYRQFSSLTNGGLFSLPADVAQGGFGDVLTCAIRRVERDGGTRGRQLRRQNLGPVWRPFSTEC